MVSIAPIVAVVACQHVGTEPPSNRGGAAPTIAPTIAAPSASPTTTASADQAGAIELTGTLRHHPIEHRRKSVEAYLGTEFGLVDDQGEERWLMPSDTVPAEALLEFDGRKVRIRCVMIPGAAANPMEQAPLGSDGAPRPRPAKCRVHAMALRAA